MKRLLLSFLLLTAAWVSHAQDFKVPAYKLDKAEDYSHYNQDVIDCADFLQSTPLGVQSAKRQLASRFMLDWTMGCPYLHLIVDSAFVPPHGEAPDLLIMFVAGWCREVLIYRRDHNIPNVQIPMSETPRDELVIGALAGVRAMNDLYLKNRAVFPKYPNVEKFIKMNERGKLEEYVSGRIATMKLSKIE